METEYSMASVVNGSEIDYLKLFNRVRKRTEDICLPLEPEDFVVQPVVDVSPPKWHLAHTTWFFETFFLPAVNPDYKVFHPDFSYLFNSYYESVGKRVLRTDRGNVTRPGVETIKAYRAYVDEEVNRAFEKGLPSSSSLEVFMLGLQHEMQHQELLLTDIKFILGHNPLFPVYDKDCKLDRVENTGRGSIKIEEGVYDIGYKGHEFCFDNELGLHKTYLQHCEIDNYNVRFGDYIDFIEDGGYDDFRHWHSDAWSWVQENKVQSPLYMHKIEGTWHRYTLSGLVPVLPNEILMHVSFYEAAAYASWVQKRLPTEFEWEIASKQMDWGNCWEWTNSAYLPYPGFKQAPGAIGEYNGKFMVNQMVLRGGAKATFPGHSRMTYRNFFHPHLQWQYSGIRLAK